MTQPDEREAVCGFCGASDFTAPSPQKGDRGNVYCIQCGSVHARAADVSGRAPVCANCGHEHDGPTCWVRVPGAYALTGVGFQGRTAVGGDHESARVRSLGQQLEPPLKGEGTMSTSCSVTTHRAPFCPSCGAVAMQHTEYREANGDTPILRNELVRLSWTCRCGCDVTVEARPGAQEPYSTATPNLSVTDSISLGIEQARQNQGTMLTEPI